MNEGEIVVELDYSSPNIKEAYNIMAKMPMKDFELGRGVTLPRHYIEFSKKTIGELLRKNKGLSFRILPYEKGEPMTMLLRMENAE